MTQFATVIKTLQDGRAEISVRRESSCGKSCASCGGCSEKNMYVTAVANNLCGAGAGDRVRVEMPTRRLLGLASLVYLLPLALFFAACLTAAALGYGEKVSIIAGVLGMAVAFVVIKAANRRVSVRSGEKMDIVAIVEGE